MNEAAMIALKARFAARCEADKASLQAIVDSGDVSTPELQSLTHKLSGAAGTFGFPSIGNAAAEIDNAISDGRTPSLNDVLGLIGAMQTALGKV
ncbi:Hpt domain-containing protein [Brevundimonas sp. DC300-4]|uniref:Hpt domain-containing protein n=1 Tax=Brevundimonas sp. DC300-4 TaxID=2804594 RepID=UPI003CECFCC4